MPSLEFVCPVVSEELSSKRQSNTKLLVASPIIFKLKKLKVTPSWRYQTRYNTHPGLVINRVKFHACLPSNLGVDKAYVFACVHAYI